MGFSALIATVASQTATIADLEDELAELDTASLEAAVSEVDDDLVEMSQCIAAAMSSTSVIPISTSTTAEPTATYTAIPEYDQLVCKSSDTYRTFKLENVDAVACSQSCLTDEDCMYFSVNAANQCIGCSQLPSVSNMYTTNYKSYMMNSSRRQLLSEKEAIE